MKMASENLFGYIGTSVWPENFNPDAMVMVLDPKTPIWVRKWVETLNPKP